LARRAAVTAASVQENLSPHRGRWRGAFRVATFVICVLDTVGWACVAYATFLTQSDPATKGFDEAEGYVVTILFLGLSGPAFALALLDRAPKAALALALAFPAVFVGLFVAAILALR
jgi:hypothetical protein